MKDAGYGEGYAYDHDAPGAFSGANYWPEGMERESYYQPKATGFEKELARRMAWWAERRET